MADRRFLSAKNRLTHLTGYEWGRNAAFACAGLGLLFGLHNGFFRLLSFLETVQLIGTFLIWKLTAMLFMMTLSMVVVSSLLTSLTTLFYSFDLQFLMRAPMDLKSIFLEKALESAFFASWMIGLILVPYAAALMRVLHLGWPFFAGFAVALPPFLLLGASLGIAFTLLLLYVFPSSRTRDVVWILSSLSLTVTYGLIRFSQPEKLIRPDALQVVADYLNFLQAPTAPFLPSWWMTRCLESAADARWMSWAADAAGLWACAFAIYSALVVLAGRVYFEAYSGAQEGALRRRSHSFRPLVEERIMGMGPTSILFWKERMGFVRDVKHWSQIMLIGGLVFVYLFSIRRLPLDTADLRSLVSFLNVGTAGFVVAALGLRFTFPAISLEGRSWWVLKASPLTIGQIMRQKFIFSAIPTLAVSLTLGVMTNWILDADLFTARLSLAALAAIGVAICAMGIGFGSLFPRFAVDNIHQVESSLGGFVYMACCLFYIGCTMALLAAPMQMHFQGRFGRINSWDWRVAAAAAAGWLLLNGAALVIPWNLGRRALERNED